MQPIHISSLVRGKLRSKHNVTELEILQCFERSTDFYLIDDRIEHATEPPTLWFVEKTRRGRPLKIVFIVRPDGIHIKSAYDADKKIVDLYHAKRIEFLLSGGLP